MLIMHSGAVAFLQYWLFYDNKQRSQNGIDEAC